MDQMFHSNTGIINCHTELVRGHQLGLVASNYGLSDHLPLDAFWWRRGSFTSRNLMRTMCMTQKGNKIYGSYCERNLWIPFSHIAPTVWGKAWGCYENVHSWLLAIATANRTSTFRCSIPLINRWRWRSNHWECHHHAPCLHASLENLTWPATLEDWSVQKYS